MNTVLHCQHPLFKLYKPDQSGASNTEPSVKYIGQLPEHAEDYDDKAVVNPWLAKTDSTKSLADGFPKSLVLSQESVRTPEGFEAAMQKIKQDLSLPCVLKVSPASLCTQAIDNTHLYSSRAAYQGTRLSWSGGDT